jgi:hypothetical protein
VRVDLGLTEDEYLWLNHRRFTILHGRQQRLKWQQEMCLAMNTAAVYRCGMREFDPLPKPADFVFAVRPGEKARIVKSQQTREHVASIFRTLSARPAPGKENGNQSSDILTEG